MTNTVAENVILDGELLGQLREDVKDIFLVHTVETPRNAAKGTIIYVGELLVQDSEAAYDLIAARWRARNYTPMLRRHKGQIGLVAQPGIVVVRPANPWINLGLAIATILSVWFTGAAVECQCLPPATVADWLGGLPMMLAMMAILLAHEFGHYFAAKYHKVAVTLPYFIPLPLISPVGTLGAFIQLRSPFKTKRQLFDIGVAGPLGGLLFAIPLVFWGVANSQMQPITRSATSEPSSVLEGNSLFYLGVKYLFHGQLLPSFEAYNDLPFWGEASLLLVGILPEGGGTDIFINMLAFAAWFGLFVTAMNLLPIGQLDGGHVIYCLIGDKARYLGLILVGLMFAAGLLWAGWLIWALLTFLVIGVGHPPPLNDLPSLGPGRTILAWVMIFIFIILFMPNPLQPL